MEFFKIKNPDKDQAELVKSALVFVEGVHVDSNKRKHNFHSSRVQSIVENTNKKVLAGERIPFQKDHKKTQDFNLGDVDSTFRTEIITPENLPNPKHTHLLGKLGVWVDKIVVKGQQAIDSVVNKTITTLSAGIDPATDSFIEISATPFPAIVGPTLFSQEADNDAFLLLEFETGMEKEGELDKGPQMMKPNKQAFSMEEALGLGKQKENMLSKYSKLSEALYNVLQSYYSASEDELQGKDPIQNSYDSIKFFVTELEDLFGLIQNEEENPILRKKSVKLDKKQLGFSRFKTEKTCRKFNFHAKFNNRN